MFVFLFCTFSCLFCVFCVFVLLCVLFLPMHIVIYILFVYNFTDHRHRVETQLQLINVISYRTKSRKNCINVSLISTRCFQGEGLRLYGVSGWSFVYILILEMTFYVA